jgi:hypothetical protein
MLYLVATEGVPPPKKKEKRDIREALKALKLKSQTNKKEDNSKPKSN